MTELTQNLLRNNSSMASLQRESEIIDMRNLAASITTLETVITSSSGPTFKHKIKGFTIDLRKNNTILDQLDCHCACLTQFEAKFPYLKHFNSKGALLSTTAISCVTTIISIWNPFHNHLTNVCVDLISTLLVLIAIILCIMKTNVYVIKQGLQSFIVYYKCFHVLIGLIAREKYYNFWTKSNNYTNVDGVGIMEITHGVLICLTAFLGIFAISIFDGFATRSNKIKRIVLLVAISFLIYFWIELYFNLYPSYILNTKQSFTINMFNTKHEYYLRSLALSSLFKTLVFTISQLSRNITIPNRINVIPLPVNIKYTYLQEKVMANYNNTPKTKVKNDNLPIARVNTGNTFTDEIGGIIAASNINSINESITSNASEDNNYSIEMATEMTLLFVILIKLFKLDHHKSLYISTMLSSQTSILLMLFMTVGCFASAFCFNYFDVVEMFVLIRIIQVFLMFLLLVNVNFTLFYYKFKSFELIWKLYDVCTLVVGIQIVTYTRHDITTGIGILNLICLAFIGMSYVVVSSMHQGYQIHKYSKFTLVIVFIVIIVFAGIFYYFGSKDRDVITVNNWFSDDKISISARSYVISTAFDLVLWLSYQCYQMIHKPNVMYLVSKIKVNWT